MVLKKSLNLKIKTTTLVCLAEKYIINCITFFGEKNTLHFCIFKNNGHCRLYFFSVFNSDLFF